MCSRVNPIQRLFMRYFRHTFVALLTVTDSITGAPPASAVLIAHSGAFIDSVGPVEPVAAPPGSPPRLLLVTAGERAGTYDLVVRSAGYRDWTQNGVEVTADRCHVNSTSVSARLQR
jgi:hypothetical protein